MSISNVPRVQQSSPDIEVFCSRQFLEWLQLEQISLAFTTYQTSRLCLIGVNPQGQLSGFERLFDRAMGLYATSERLFLSTKYQLWQLDNALALGELYNGYDKLYIPRIGYTTGDLDIHDVAIATPPPTPSPSTGRGLEEPPLFKGGQGGIVFVSTLLNCLATLSETKSCTPLWKPKFISKIVNEDRCHLNGLAMVEGQTRFVTACSRSDVVDGWRDKRRDGGVVIDIPSNEIILSGLSMPHSPRFYQGKLWLHNSGSGEFGYVDLQPGKFEPVTFCPGYLRGLAFWKNYAIVGLSKPRSGDKTFSGLSLDDKLIAKDTEARCGLMVIDLNSGNIIHWLRLEGLITELYDVQVLPGMQRPMALGFQTEEISQLITLDLSREQAEPGHE
ncbi:TIGR03032 family protein [Argonema antarcticum]|uniref:TIGR03032 family protein n=1 Tax=Argonema antarcticum TaxID=2942763 RepID=UPI002013A955|nr:TIGR03032 family protein [Argonema antarcticum]MCL1470133.1 TIGR03032 family protein [Argonema antarcticum A004/B2]